MLFNNFSMTQTSDDLMVNLSVLKNISSNRDGTATGGNHLETFNAGDFLCSPDIVAYIDFSRLTKPQRRPSHFTDSAQLTAINDGFEDTEYINYIPSPVNTRQNKNHANSNIVPSAFLWHANPDLNLPQMDVAIRRLDHVEDISKSGRPSGYNLHNGTHADAASLNINLYDDAVGGPTTWSNNVKSFTSFTAFIVYHPVVNGDGSGLSYPGTSSASDAITSNFLTDGPGDDNFISISDKGKFKIAVAGQSTITIDVGLDAADTVATVSGIGGRINREKWDYRYYATQNGYPGVGNTTGGWVADAKPTLEPIIWCIDIINDGTGGNLTLADHTSLKTQTNPSLRYQDRINDHTTWWHAYNSDGAGLDYLEKPDTYDNLFGSADPSAGIWIYNQYGVLVGYSGKQTNGIGHGTFSFGSIGFSEGSNNGIKNLHGYHCETLVSGVPLSMAKKHHILSHLRVKWGIQNLYTNGKPFHD